MTAEVQHIAGLVIVAGLIVVGSLLIRSLLLRVHVPALVGYLGLGFVIALLNSATGFFNASDLAVFDFLGELGVIVLLFTVGLECRLKSLAGQLKRATPIWLLNMLVAGTLAFLTVFYLLDLGPIPSLVAGIAFTATSVGVPSAVWQQEQLIDTDEGQLFVDVAELDDLSGIVLMALLFAVLPSLATTGSGGERTLDLNALPWQDLALTTLEFIGKLAVFILGAWLFARYVVPRLYPALTRWEWQPDPVISVVAVAAVIAGISGLLGFSAAIGGFVAGLAFSRLQQRGEMNRNVLSTLHHLFVPFFFIAVGLSLEPSTMGMALLPALVLFGAAAIGKVLGAGLPAWPLCGSACAGLIGISMVPRAEITLIVMSQGQNLGDWAVPQSLYNATIICALLTCLISPLAMRMMMKRSSLGRDERHSQE